MIVFLRRATAILILTSACCWSALAQNNFSIQPAHSGTWFNAEQSGHGLFIQVLEGGIVVTCWFVFDLDGNRAWLCGSGVIDGNQVLMNVNIVEGGAFPPLFDSEQINRIPWGTLLLIFQDCDNVLVEWVTEHPGFSSGSLDMQRLTGIAGLVCQPPPAVQGLVIPRTTAIVTANGMFQPGEWDQAATQTIFIRSDFQVTLYYQADDEFVYFAFENVGGPGDINLVNMVMADTLFPEIFINVNPPDGQAFGNDNHWFHASFQDCYQQGLFNVAIGCNFFLPDWQANNFPLASPGITEIRIAYSRLNITPEQTPAIGLLATMTSSLLGIMAYNNWPAGSDVSNPSSWETMVLPQPQ